MGKVRYLIMLALIAALAVMMGCAGCKKPPTVESVSPNKGPETGGTTIKITGTNFKEGATVTIGGNPAKNVTVASKTEITAITPPGKVGAVDVVVTNPNQLSGTLSGGFTYTDATPPKVSSTDPADGALIDPKDAVDTGVTKITVTYNEPIASEGTIKVHMVSLEDALAKHEGDIEGTISYEGNSIIFNAAKPLISARKYTVSVSGVKDLAGNAASDYTFGFSIKTPKRVHWYIVRKGDTLPKIAARPDTYDNAKRWPWIVEGNQDDYNFDRDKIYVGQRLFIPWWEGK